MITQAEIEKATTRPSGQIQELMLSLGAQLQTELRGHHKPPYSPTEQAAELLCR